MQNFRRNVYNYLQSIKLHFYWVSLLFVFLFIYSALILLCTPSSTLADNDSYWQSVIPYFEANDFESAYAELENLLDAKPDNSLLLRLQGICLLELGNVDSSVNILERSLSLDPESIACRYYYAKALALQGSLLAAIEMLNDVIKLSPESEYAKQSKVVISKLKNLAGSGRAISDAKRWDLYANISSEYDDNVSGRANNSTLETPKDSWRTIYTFFGEYRILDQKLDSSPLSLGAGYSINGSKYHRNRFSAYDMFSQRLIFYIKHNDSLWDRFYTIKLEGNYGKTMLDWEDYSDVGGFEGSFNYNWHERVSSKLTLGGYRNEFKDDSDYPELYSRDGNSYKIGMENYVYLMENSLILGIHYKYRIENPEGELSVIRSNDLTGSLNAYLPWQLSFSVSATYQQEDFMKNIYNPERLDNLWTYYVSIERPVWQNWLTLGINYTHTTANSNWDFADYTRNIIGISLSANF